MNNKLLTFILLGFSWQLNVYALDKKGEIEGSLGKDLYEQHCSVCHGDLGDGKSGARHGLEPPPRDFTTQQAGEILTRLRMIKSVTEGRAGTAMVAWKGRLDEGEIASIVDYIRDRFMRVTSEAVDHPGKAIYVKNCSVCHGDKGSGATWTKSGLNPPPRAFTQADPYNELTRARMINSVTYGRPGTAMVSFKTRFDAEEIENVVSYIRQNFMGVKKESSEGSVEIIKSQGSENDKLPVQADMSMVFPHGIIGNEKKGHTFYMKNCVICHGKTGDGKGERGRAVRAKPRNFLSADSAARFNRPALFLAIAKGKQGTVMPAWKSVLDNQSIADVAEFVFQAYILKTIDPLSGNKKKVK